MKLALINNVHVDHLGFYFIAAVAKQAGWDTRLFLTSTGLERELRAFGPDVFGFTATTGNHGWAIDLARDLKRTFPRGRFVFGGPHPTYYPEVIETEVFDAIVRGEGEESFPELLAAVESGDSLSGIDGTWAFEEGRVHRSPLREAPQDLDALPFADRSLYDDYPWLGVHRYPLMISSRGCPFKCTFCYSPTMTDMMRDKGKFVRFRSVENVVAEGVEIKRRYQPDVLEFVDDIFGMSRSWLREFRDQWSREVGIPYNITIRADLLDEETVPLLKESGCQLALVGFESGNDRIRNDILKKDLSRDRVLQAGELLRTHGITYISLNIFGSPGETIENCLETIRFNQELGPDHGWASLLIPFPRTGIYKQAVDAGMIEDEVPVDRFAFTFFQRTPLVRDDMGGIMNLQRIFPLVIQFPALNPLARWLSRQPEIPGLSFVFLMTHFYYLLRFKRVSFSYLARLTLNVKELWRRYRAGAYARVMPQQQEQPVTV